MFVVRTSLRPSPIHGIGAFTEEPIRKGQLVWQFDPRLDIRIPLGELSKFPPAAQEHIRIRAYAEMVEGRKLMTLCTDNAQYVNHSSRPNLLDSADGLREIAARDIAAGEELTCNYYEFDLTAEEKLGNDPIES